jgi:hypothetical protein
MPVGPWVLVIGSHRSGTSAVTGALVALGLNGVAPSDRMDRPDSNPEHWESLSVALYNEDLLVRRGGTWDAPPAFSAETPGANPSTENEDAARLMATAYPAPGPLVWKDPRTSLLLPHWRALLPGPLAAVFVWRDPLAVAQSLHKRDVIPIEDGLALWDHYNRSAAAGLNGVDTYVLDYGSVATDPSGALDALADWLQDLEQFAGQATHWDVRAAASSIDGGLRHHEGGATGNGGDGLPMEQRALVHWLESVGGGHRPFANQPPPAPSPWTEAVIRLRREPARLASELRLLRREPELRAAELRGLQLHLANIQSSSSWRITKPLRSVLARLQHLR